MFTFTSWKKVVCSLIRGSAPHNNKLQFENCSKWFRISIWYHGIPPFRKALEATWICPSDTKLHPIVEFISATAQLYFEGFHWNGTTRIQHIVLTEHSSLFSNSLSGVVLLGHCWAFSDLRKASLAQQLPFGRWRPEVMCSLSLHVSKPQPSPFFQTMT